ncbi:tetratricopeptide repeat protein [Flavobacterium sp.]|uniref:tetratricopeptide repeat protein n=1 Tax=Flavobacterium sp. TaxID=239 RepID=UPI002636FF40|nr:tetratricopeptide repeat protein [Flavobacterium sp.]
MKKIFLQIVLFSFSISYAQEGKNKEQEKIIEEFLTNCAQRYNYNTRMSDWQNCLDNGLAKDSTIAYLWQQKAMPYFKARKYEIGMPFLDKAVYYNAERWQPYRGFMKCIFSKSYKDAIEDLEDCKKKFGNQYVMDHTYDFYIALSYLQLNEFEKAEKILQNYVDEIYKNRDKLEHPTAYFYLGIAKFELKKFDEAIAVFDKALKVYPNFSDVKFYKAICLVRKDKIEEAKILLKESEEDYKIGYKLNEDNTIYETYPYQKKWDKQ